MLLHVYIRFGKWEEIAAYPMPEDAELYVVSGHLLTCVTLAISKRNS